MRSFLLLGAVATVARAQQNCPTVECVNYDSFMEPNNLCMYHSDFASAWTIKLRPCTTIPNQVCNMFALDFGWT